MRASLAHLAEIVVVIAFDEEMYRLAYHCFFSFLDFFFALSN